MEPVEYKFNNLIISHEELDNTAEHYAEMYHYDRANGCIPDSPMKIFEDNFGYCDDEHSYMGIFVLYFELCQKHKTNPAIIEKYYDEDQDPNNFDYEAAALFSKIWKQVTM